MKDAARGPWSFTIPSHWTPAQADAVFELLSHLADAVFCAYELPLVEIAAREAQGRPPYDAADPAAPQHDDDPIPF